MESHREILLRAVNGAPFLLPANPDDSAKLFASAALAAAAMPALKEQRWMWRAQPTEFRDFLRVAFRTELAPLNFLQSTLAQATEKDFELMQQRAHSLITQLVNWSGESQPETFRAFVTATAKEIAGMVGVDSAARNDFRDNVIYRAFDRLDEVLGLNYTHDNRDPQTSRERIYPGSGAGVQSSYVTLIRTLRTTGFEDGHFVDLGSGYGRAGLLVGLLYPQARATGYEYVDYRVRVANESARRLGVADRIGFVTQDLFAADFVLPSADIYYLYDPFTPETYARVFSLLLSRGEREVITVAAKGGAREGFAIHTKGRPEWLTPTHADAELITLFRSQPRNLHRSAHQSVGL